MNTTTPLQQKIPKMQASAPTTNGIWGYIIATYVWTIVPLLTIFFCSLILLLTPIALATNRRRNILHKVATWWAKSIIQFNPWWTFEIFGKENLPDENTPVVYVANHQSQADILAVFLINRQFRWLAKDSLFKIPIFGWAMRAVGYVPVKRGNKHSHIRCFRRAREHLEQGTSMLFFPEGTRSTDGKLHTFKNGAFRLAADARVGVMPITVEGASNLLPKGSMIPAVATVRITVHPIIPSDNTIESKVISRAKEAIASALIQK